MATIDATDLILGRMCTEIAKRAMLGEKIEIVNCEKALVSGEKRYTIKRYVNKIHRGTPFNGPFFPKAPEYIVKRTIRGMVPYKKYHGEKAMKNIKCYAGIPEKLKGNKCETIAKASVSSSNISKYMTLANLSKQMGAKQ
jgi:large subunit ribosomal protein L13